MHDKIITGVTVTHVSRESLGALSSRTAVVVRVKISNISKKKKRKKEKEECCIIVGIVVVYACVGDARLTQLSVVLGIR